MKTSRWILGTIYALCFSVLVAVLGTCNLFVTHDVKYEVTGSAISVDVTYEKIGDTIKNVGVLVPWSLSFTTNGDDDVYISAKNKGASGSVTVTIYDNDSEFRTSTKSGAYVIAEASGTLQGFDASGAGGPWGNQASVICAELHRQGLMEETIFEADEAFGRSQEKIIETFFWVINCGRSRS